MVEQTKMTMDAFVELVEQNPDKHFTFNAEGDVIEVSPKRIHSWMQSRYAQFLWNYLDGGALPGYDVLTECAHLLGDWPCRPDVSINSAGDEEIPTTAPLVAVEIKSLSNSYIDLRDKAAQYMVHGTQMVILSFPVPHLLEVYQPGQDVQILTMDDTLDGGEVLPGFTIAVKDLFPPSED
jgi:Uma2 family endonuclease